MNRPDGMAKAQAVFDAQYEAHWGSLKTRPKTKREPLTVEQARRLWKHLDKVFGKP